MADMEPQKQREPQPNNEAPLFLTAEEINGLANSRVEKVNNILKSSLKQCSEIGATIAQDTGIHLARIIQPEELHLCAINAYCENGTFALPPVPPTVPPQFLGSGISPDSHLIMDDGSTSLMFEHMMLDARHHRGVSGPAMEAAARRTGFIVCDQNVYIEYVDMFQKVACAIRDSGKYDEALSDFVAKRAAVSLATGNNPLGVAPNFLQLGGRVGNKIAVLAKATSSESSEVEKKCTLFPLESANTALACHVGYAFLSEYLSVAALPDLHFKVHEDIAFLRSVLSKTANYMQIQNISVYGGDPAQMVAPATDKVALALMQRVYTAQSSDSVIEFLETVKQSLISGGGICVVQSHTASDSKITTEELTESLSSNGYDIVEQKQYHYKNPNYLNMSRESLLAIPANELYRLAQNPIYGDSSSEVFMGRIGV